MPETMTHNSFDFFRDLTLPLIDFLDLHCTFYNKNEVDYEYDKISLSDIYFIDHDFERLKRRERMKK